MTELLPLKLRCDFRENPLGIDTLQPSLSWQLQADGRARVQNAYRIRVASSEDGLASGSGDLWDSGRIVSGQNNQVSYQGKPLASGTRYWWNVEVWEGGGQQSTVSAPAWWEMGLLQPQDWQADWIGLPRLPAHDNPNLQASPYLRKTLSLEKPIRAARLYATARGLYELHLNGARVSDALLTPGWTDYQKHLQYQTYDVTTLLQSGENVLGAILGTGWYCGYVGFEKQPGLYSEQMALLVQLRIEYSDGTSETIGSDTSWQGSAGPILYADLQQGEYYDARAEQVGWDQPGFPAENWQSVQVQASEQALLVAEPTQPIRVTEELAVREIKQLTQDIAIVDMGQNMVGWVRLKASGAAGTRIQLRFAEMLNHDGTLYTTNLRGARQTDTFVLQGSGVEEVFEPHFTFHGFRYVEVSGYPGELTPESLTGCVVHSDTPASGQFSCSNELVNQLQHNILWGQRGNFLSIPTDCPQRDERLGWMGDAQIFVRTATYNMDVASFFTKWMVDVEDGQSQEGAFPDVAPVIPEHDFLGKGAPAWGDAGIIVPWTLYQVYGDRNLIERHYPAMQRWLSYIGEANPDHLRTQRLNNNYGDWLSIEADTPKDVLATAYYAYDAQLLAQIAHALGKEADAQQYQQLFEAIRQAFIDAYVQPDGRIKGETQTCYVLALFMNLLPEELCAKAVAHLVAAIEEKNWHLSTGFVGVGYLCPVLTRNGHNAVAYRLLLNETFPSWGYSIKHGATTIWERWDGWTEEKGFQDPGMNSFNHYSLGSVGQWLFQYVAGIDAEQPGYQRIRIEPWPDPALNAVQAEYASVQGLIRSAWNLDGTTFRLQITIPANTLATVVLPAAEGARILEGQSSAEQAEGVTFVGREHGKSLFRVASGDYVFTVEGEHAKA